MNKRARRNIAFYLIFITMMMFGFVNCGGSDNGSGDIDLASNDDLSEPPEPPPADSTAGIPYYSYSTLIDGNSGTIANASWEVIRDVAYDSAGNMYVTGGTAASDFPTLNAYDSTFNVARIHPGTVDMDVFVMKLNPFGKIIWSTFIGSGDYDRAYSLELGPNGDVYVAGRAGEGYPTTAGVVQPTFSGDRSPNQAYGFQDGFVSKFSQDGRHLWSTYIGEAGPGFIRDIAVDSQDRVHIAFTNMNSPLPYISANASQKAIRGAGDAAYVVLRGDGQQIIHATYFGGSDAGKKDGLTPSIQVNSRDEAIMLTLSNADDLPITPNAYQQTRRGGYDFVIVKYTANFQIDFCTYLGGRGHEFLETHELALDSVDNIYIASGTDSLDYPITAGAFQPQLKNSQDIIISKLSPNGSQLLNSTYFGGTANEYVEGVTFDAYSNRLIVTGNTLSTDFPTTSNALDQTANGGSDALLVAFDLSLQPIYSSYFGGSGHDQARGIATSAQGKILFGGMTASPSIPLKNPIDATRAGTWGVFLTEIGFQ